jgi:hypothetical protein
MMPGMQDRAELQQRWWSQMFELCALIRPRIEELYDLESEDDRDEMAEDYAWGLLRGRYEPDTAGQWNTLDAMEVIDAEIEELGGWVDPVTGHNL